MVRHTSASRATQPDVRSRHLTCLARLPQPRTGHGRYHLRTRAGHHVRITFPDNEFLHRWRATGTKTAVALITGWTNSRTPYEWQ